MANGASIGGDLDQEVAEGQGKRNDTRVSVERLSLTSGVRGSTWEVKEGGLNLIGGMRVTDASRPSDDACDERTSQGEWVTQWASLCPSFHDVQEQIEANFDV